MEEQAGGRQGRQSGLGTCRHVERGSTGVTRRPSASPIILVLGQASRVSPAPLPCCDRWHRRCGWPKGDAQRGKATEVKSLEVKHNIFRGGGGWDRRQMHTVGCTAPRSDEEDRVSNTHPQGHRGMAEDGADGGEQTRGPERVGIRWGQPRSGSCKETQAQSGGQT